MPRTEYTVATNNRFAQLDSDVESEAPGPVSQPKTTTAPASRPQRQRQLREPKLANQPKAPNSSMTEAVQKTAALDRGDEQKSSTVTPDQRNARRRERPYISDGKQKSTLRAPLKRLDRHSGTGRGREMKKSGEGGFNWGNETKSSLRPSVEPSGPQVPDPEAAAFLVSQRNKEDTTNGQSETSTTCQQNAPAGTSHDSSATKQQNRAIPFAEYERDRKMKRSALQQEQTQHMAAQPSRRVDASQLEEKHYQPYPREETAEERLERERRLQKLYRGRSDVSDESIVGQRPHKNQQHQPLFEFSSSLGHSRRQQRGARASGIQPENKAEKKRSPSPVTPLDLTDTAAFPLLS